MDVSDWGTELALGFQGLDAIHIYSYDGTTARMGMIQGRRGMEGLGWKCVCVWGKGGGCVWGG